MDTLKLLDSSRINKLGWKPEIELNHGISSVYEDFVSVIIQLKIGDITFHY